MKTGQGIRFVLGSTTTTAGQRNWVVRLRRCIDDFLEFFDSWQLQLGQLHLFLGGSRNNCTCRIFDDDVDNDNDDDGDDDDNLLASLRYRN